MKQREHKKIVKKFAFFIIDERAKDNSITQDEVIYRFILKVLHQPYTEQRHWALMKDLQRYGLWK